MRSNAITRRQAGSLRLCRTERLFSRAPAAQWHYLYDRSELDRALALAERLRAIGTQDSSTEKSSLAFRAIGSTLMSKGEFVRATEAFERVITNGSDTQPGACFARHGEEPHIVALQYKGLSLAVRGYTRLRPCISAVGALVGQDLELSINGGLRLDCCWDGVDAPPRLPGLRRSCSRADRVLLGARFYFLVCCARNSSRRLANCLDRDPDGVAQLEDGIKSWKNTGAALHIPTWSSYLAEAALCVGDIDCAEKAVVNGIKTSERHGDAFALADLKRLAG